MLAGSFVPLACLIFVLVKRSSELVAVVKTKNVHVQFAGFHSMCDVLKMSGGWLGSS